MLQITPTSMGPEDYAEAPKEGVALHGLHIEVPALGSTALC